MSVEFTEHSIHAVVERLKKLRSMLLPSTVELGVVLFEPRRLVRDPASPRHGVPSMLLYYVDSLGHREPVAHVEVFEHLGGSRFSGRIRLYTSDATVDVVLDRHGSAVRTDLSRMPIEHYVFLLLLADALGLDYVRWHRAFAFVVGGNTRATLTMTLIMNVLARLIDLCLALYTALEECASRRATLRDINKLAEARTREVLRAVLLEKSSMPEINQLLRDYLDIPHTLVAYTPTCEVCGRRVELFIIPGDVPDDLSEAVVEHGVSLDNIYYASAILRVLSEERIPLLCRTCRQEFRKLYSEYSRKIQVSTREDDLRLRMLILDELRRRHRGERS